MGAESSSLWPTLPTFNKKYGEKCMFLTQNFVFSSTETFVGLKKRFFFYFKDLKNSPKLAKNFEILSKNMQLFPRKGDDPGCHLYL